MKIEFKDQLFKPILDCNQQMKDLEENPHFFKQFQNMDYLINFLPFYSNLNRILNDEDSFIVEFDVEAGLHLLLHKSNNFNVTRPICYLDHNKFEMKQYIPFVIECLKEAWVEYEL